MELKLFCFVLIFALSFAAPYHGDFYDYSCGELDHRKSQKVDVKQETESAVAKFYEVVENVDDIPNPTPEGTILAKYTTRKPLNVVPENANNDNNGNEATTNLDNNVTPNIKNEPMNNPYYSDLEKENLEADEVDFNFDDENDEGNGEKPSLRSYVIGLLKKAIINGLKTLIQRVFFRNENFTNDPNEHSNLVLHLEKLRKNSYEDRHRRYFGHDFEY